MAMEPFLRINPCGYAGMEMVQTKQINGPKTLEEASVGLVKHLVNKLGVTEYEQVVGF